MKRLALIAAIAACGCTLSAPQEGASLAGVWLRGDLHVHDDHSSDGSLPRQRSQDRAKGNVSVADQIGQAEKAGLEFLPLTDHRTWDQQYDPKWESSKLLLIPGEEANGSPHATVHGAIDSIVQGAARPGSAFAHIQQSIWNAHSQGATWTIAHPDDGEVNDDGSPNERASVQGVDLVEIWNKASDIEKEIDYSEDRWNAGFRFGVAGASDSHFREYWDRQGPGFPTTNVLARAANERGVLNALRAGRTSLSFSPIGPFIELTTDLGGGAMAGDEIIAPAGKSGELRLRVQRAKGMEVTLYRAPGRSAGPFRTFTPASDDEVLAIDIATTDSPDWYRAEVRGMSTVLPPIRGSTRPQPAESVKELKAIASPIFISPAPVEAKPEIALPADQGGDDTAVLALGAAGDFLGFPDVVTLGDSIHIVAESHGSASSSIVYRRRDGANAWSGTRVLSGEGLARFPRIAAHGRDVWVTWQEDARRTPHRPEIKLRHSADGGATWRALETIRSIQGRAEHPDIAVNGSGRPLLVWQEIRAGEPFDVMLQDIGIDAEPRNLSRAGKVFGPGEPDDTRSARYPASVLPAIAVAEDGWRYVVVWQDNRTDPDPLWTGSAAAPGTNPDNWQVMVATLDPETVHATPVSLGAADMADRHPDVAFGTRGELVVAWETKTLNPAGRNLSVLAAVSTDGGATFGASATLGPEPQAMSERPRLGVDETGAVRAVWYDSRSDDWRWRVMLAGYSPLSGWSAAGLINGRGVNTWPATSGGAIVFASTRNATRLQRDATQQIFLLGGK
jgi:hypothetical protein